MTGRCRTKGMVIMAKKAKKKYTSIGGQALMEGIMMRGPKLTTMAVRRLDGSIYTETTVNAEPSVWNKIPFVRGVVNFVQSMTSGSKVLMRSADLAIEDEERMEKERKAAELAAKEQPETTAADNTAATEESSAEFTAETVSEEISDTAAVEIPDKAPDADAEAAIETAAEAVNDAPAGSAAEFIAETKAEISEMLEEVKEEAAQFAADAKEKAAEFITEVKEEIAEIIDDIGAGRADETAAAVETAEAVEIADTDESAPAETRDIMDIFGGSEKKTTPEEWLNPHGETAAADNGASSDRKAKKDDKKKDGDMEGWTFLSVILGIALAALLFVFLPTWGYGWLLKIPGAAAVIGGKVWKSVIEGVIRIIVFILYILLCTTMKEIRRVFEYHGAEHKTIFCYEAGEELTVENVKKYKRFHPRCGTSFIVLTVLVGIAAGIFISVMFPQLDNTWLRPVIKLAMLPVIMGVGYELLKLCGRFDNIFTRIIRAPGLWVQRITTREPDDGQIECAIAALKPVIPENGEDML